MFEAYEVAVKLVSNPEQTLSALDKMIEGFRRGQEAFQKMQTAGREVTAGLNDAKRSAEGLASALERAARMAQDTAKAAREIHAAAEMAGNGGMGGGGGSRARRAGASGPGPTSAAESMFHAMVTAQPGMAGGAGIPPEYWGPRARGQLGFAGRESPTIDGWGYEVHSAALAGGGGYGNNGNWGRVYGSAGGGFGAGGAFGTGSTASTWTMGPAGGGGGGGNRPPPGPLGPNPNAGGPGNPWINNLRARFSKTLGGIGSASMGLHLGPFGSYAAAEMGGDLLSEAWKFTKDSFEQSAEQQAIVAQMLSDPQAPPVLRSLLPMRDSELARNKFLTRTSFLKNVAEIGSATGNKNDPASLAEGRRLLGVIDQMANYFSAVNGGDQDKAEKDSLAVFRAMDISSQFFDPKTHEFSADRADSAVHRMMSIAVAASRLSNPQKLLSFVTSLGSAAPQLSDAGWYNVEHLLELGSSRPANAVRSLEGLFSGTGQIMYKRNQKYFRNAMVRGDDGKSHPILSDAGFYDNQLLHSNPVEYITKYLGQLDPQQLSDHLQRMTLSDLKAIITWAKGNIQKNADMAARTDPLGNINNIAATGKGAEGALRVSFANFSSAWGDFEQGPGIKILDYFTRKLGDWTKFLGDPKNAGEIQKDFDNIGAAILGFIKLMNAAISLIPPEVLAVGKAAIKAETATGNNPRAAAWAAGGKFIGDQLWGPSLGDKLATKITEDLDPHKYTTDPVLQASRERAQRIKWGLSYPKMPFPGVDSAREQWNEVHPGVPYVPSVMSGYVAPPPASQGVDRLTANIYIGQNKIDAVVAEILRDSLRKPDSATVAPDPYNVPYRPGSPWMGNLQ